MTYIAEVTETTDVEFRCGSCGHRAWARVSTAGAGAAWNRDKDAHDEEIRAVNRAANDALNVAHDTLESIACPRCGKRKRQGDDAFSIIIKVVAPAMLGAALGLAVSGPAMAALGALAAAAVGGSWIFLHRVRVAHAEKTVQFFDGEPSDLPYVGRRCSVCDQQVVIASDGERCSLCGAVVHVSKCLRKHARKAHSGAAPPAAAPRLIPPTPLLPSRPIGAFLGLIIPAAIAGALFLVFHKGAGVGTPEGTSDKPAGARLQIVNNSGVDDVTIFVDGRPLDIHPPSTPTEDEQKTRTVTIPVGKHTLEAKDGSGKVLDTQTMELSEADYLFAPAHDPKTCFVLQTHTYATRGAGPKYFRFEPARSLWKVPAAVDTWWRDNPDKLKLTRGNSATRTAMRQITCGDAEFAD